MPRGRGRTWRSAEEWTTLIARQRRSGLSRAAFCRREGIALGTFTKWKRRVRSRDERAAGFVDVTPRSGRSAGWEMEVELPNGVVLRWRG